MRSGLPNLRAALLAALTLVLLGCAGSAQAVGCLDSGIVPDRIERCSAEIKIASQPYDEAQLRLTRATEYRYVGDWEMANADIDAALALYPDYAAAYVERAHVLRGQNLNEEAVAAFDEALELEPNNLDARIYRADTYDTLGDPQRCLDELEGIEELAPDDPYVFAVLGRCRFDNGETAAAIDDYEKAVELGIQESVVLANLSLAYLTNDEAEEAREVADEAVALNERDPYAQRALADALVALGETDAAIEAYERWQALGDADTLNLANSLAWQLYLAGEYEDALEIIEPVFPDLREATPEEYFQVDTYGQILGALGRKDEALEAMMLAAELGGPDQVAFYRSELESLGLIAGPGTDGLREAMADCIDTGADCRLE